MKNFSVNIKMYMVKVSYEQKPFRREVMRTYGASVTPSPNHAGASSRLSLQGSPWQNGFVCVKRNRCIEQEPAGAPIFYVSLFNLTAT